MLVKTVVRTAHLEIFKNLLPGDFVIPRSVFKIQWVKKDKESPLSSIFDKSHPVVLAMGG